LIGHRSKEIRIALFEQFIVFKLRNRRLSTAWEQQIDAFQDNNLRYIEFGLK